jgi:hypothetical protein
VSYNYIVSYSIGSNGPWTQAGTSSTASFTINNLSNGNYYVQVIAVDTVTGLQSSPAVGGPFTVGSVTTQQESPDQTSVTSSSQTIFSSKTPGQPAPTGGPFDTWSITGQGGQVVHNGVSDPTTSALLQLYYLGHVVYQQASNGNSFGTPGWWSWTGTTWADAQSPIGQVLSITGISLSNSIIAAGAPAGTVVGTLAVTMSFGSFSGSLALGGANASSFSLSGSNTVVTTPASFPTGNFSLAATATQASASNSPFTTPQPFSIVSQSSSAGPGPPASSPFITADFTAAQNYPNGGSGQQIVSQRMWGVSTGAAANTNSGAIGTNCQAFTNTQFQTAAATINPGIWRINGDQSVFNYWNSSQVVQTAAFANLVNNFYKVDPLGISSVVIGINVPAQGNIPGITSTGQMQTAAQNLATYLSGVTMPNGKKFPIIGFESANETNGAIDFNTFVSYYNAMVTGVRAANPNLLLFGPAYNFAPPAGDGFTTSASRIDVYDWHNYPGSSPGTRFATDMQRANANSQAVAQALFMGEWNMNGNPPGDPNQRTYIGAVFAAAGLLDSLNQAKFPFWAAIWDALGDGNYGMIADPLNGDPGGYGIYPQGFLTAQGVRNIFGPRYQVTTNSTGLGTCAVVPSAGRFGLMVVNNGQGNKSGSIALSHWPVNSTGTATANVWQMRSSQSGDGAPSTVQVTKGVCASLNFPDPSVTIISI